MVNPLVTLSIVILYTETLLISYISVQTYYTEDTSIFTTFILLVGISFVLTSISSALMATTDLNLSGRYPGKALCFAMHLCQLSLIWRFGKLLFAYDRKGLLELMTLRLIHVAIQTLPFLVLHSYLIVSSDTTTLDAVSVLALAVTLMSASISITMFCSREHIHTCWNGGTKRSSNNTKRHCGVFLLLLGTTLVLSVRLACLVLMCLVLRTYVLVLAAVHMLILIFGYISVKAARSESLELKDVLVKVGLSYLNVFDLVEGEVYKVQCKYVSFYTLILLENMLMVGLWLFLSPVDYIFKLIVIVLVLAFFICALVMKFASCSFMTFISDGQQAGETPDNATIAESKNIIKALSHLPTVSSSIQPHLNNNVDDHASPVSTFHSHTDVKNNISTSKARSDFSKVNAEFASVVTQKPVSSMNTDNDTTNVNVNTESCSMDYQSQRSFISISKNNSRKQTPIEPILSPLDDVCSSNSRNTNTVLTSAIGTSQSSVTQSSKAKVNKTKIVFPLGNINSTWKKIALRMPSMSNFLIRSHEKSFKPCPGSEIHDPFELHCGDSMIARGIHQAALNNVHSNKADTHSTDAIVNQKPSLEATKISTCHFHTGIAGDMKDVADPSPDCKVTSSTAPLHQLTKDERVQLWLADMKRSKLTHSHHSSSCSVVSSNKYPFENRVKDIHGIDANVPHRSEVTESYPCLKENTNPFSLEKYKFRSSEKCPILHHPSRHGRHKSQATNNCDSLSTKRRKSDCSKGRRGKAVILQRKLCYKSEPSLPAAEDVCGELRQSVRQRNRQSITGRTDITARSKSHMHRSSETLSGSMLETDWAPDANSSVVPRAVALGDLESLV